MLGMADPQHKPKRKRGIDAGKAGHAYANE